MTLLVFVAALAFALAVRGGAVFGIALLFLVFVPIEKLFSLRRQRVFRKGVVTDLTHLLVNNTFVTVGAVALAVVGSLPLIWLRRFDLESLMPGAVALALAVVLVFVGSYWGHRLTHTVPLLWRFHSVHHSIEEMDWVAAGRLHPLDSAFTQAFAIAPLLVLGYDAGVFGGATVIVALLAIFQHANVRLRFPVLRWIVPTPEWHHWHHALDDEARNTNFGLPVVDKLFGTAHLPKGRRPTGFGTDDPVPQGSYLRHLAYPFATAPFTEASRGVPVHSG
jgi:sterol desaturase/sphingolipid hydroxylase (fatty acid hydroxylase superfamily)